MCSIDVTFDFYSDTPKGKDPDSCSPTLRRYHKVLWSKPLPDGFLFVLSDQKSGAYLHHRSSKGEFFLSSDAIGHTYRHVKEMAPIVSRIPVVELDAFYRLCSTIGAYIIFPSKKVQGGMTINAARGFNRQIRDRFDLTLECIRRYYVGLDSPLAAVLKRYASFFELFGNFNGYVDFFLLQDLVDERGNVHFFLPYEDFSRSPLPQDGAEYGHYMERLSAFVRARNQRIIQAMQSCK